MIPGLVLDAEDEERVAARGWVLSKRGYPVTRVRQFPIRQAVYLHHFLIGRPLWGLVIDHVNGNRLDNRKANLRICDRKENLRNMKRKKNNKSGQAGVSELSPGRWRARLMLNRKEIHLGVFDTFSEAKAARLAAEVEYYRQFAPSISRGVA